MVFTPTETGFKYSCELIGKPAIPGEDLMTTITQTPFRVIDVVTGHYSVCFHGPNELTEYFRSIIENMEPAVYFIFDTLNVIVGLIF